MRRRMMMRQDTQTDILYKIPVPTEFDGVDDYIDTGIKLFNVADDWTIYFAADISHSAEQTGNNIPVFHCIYELSLWPGISFQGGNNKSYAGKYNGGNWSNLEITSGIETYYQGCVVCENKFVKHIYDKRSSAEGMRELPVNHTANFIENVKKASLLLGCYQDVNGTKGRFWKGTIYDFIVYDRALSENEANKLFQ